MSLTGQLILFARVKIGRLVGERSKNTRHSYYRIGRKTVHFKLKELPLKMQPLRFLRQTANHNKTHPETGEVKNIGGAKFIRLLSGAWVDRDVVGARNILLRALVDIPLSADWQLSIT